MADSILKDDDIPFDEDGISDEDGIPVEDVTMEDIEEMSEIPNISETPKIKVAKLTDIEDILSMGAAEVAMEEPVEEDEEYSSSKTKRRGKGKKKESIKTEPEPLVLVKGKGPTPISEVPAPGLEVQDTLTGGMPPIIQTSGTYFVSRQYKLAKDVIDESEEEIATPVHVFVTTPAKVIVKLGGTINLQNYESLRIDFGIEMPCYKEDIVKVKDQILEFIDGELEKEITNAKKSIAEKKAGITAF